MSDREPASRETPFDSPSRDKGFVDLLAELLTNVVAREEWSRHPEKILTQYKLNAAEIYSFQNLKIEDIQRQAQVLIDKRWHEVAQLIPLTLKSRGPELKDTFEFFATNYWPTDHQRHLLDAIEFLSFLETNKILQPDPSEKRWIRKLIAD